MKLFYIAPQEQLATLHGFHALDLGNGMHLVCVHWQDEVQELQWASHPDVMSLPHPIFQSAHALADEHLAHLTRRYELLAKGHTVHDLIKHASKEDPFMRLHVL